METLFGKVDLPLGRSDLSGNWVYQGGPVQTERGFVLHVAAQDPASEQAAAAYASTMTIPGGLEMTTSKDVLEALSMGEGPKQVLISLGYSAWGGGQLEAEIADNSWLTVGADAAVIFDTPVDQRYERACALLGLQSWMLSTQVGHA